MTTDAVFGQMPDGREVRLLTIGSAPGPVVEVCDQGPGIDPALRRGLFSRFAQGDMRTRGSAGLGLAIVYRIAEVHGGVVAVANGDQDSEGGEVSHGSQGAVFSLCIPDRCKEAAA